MKAILLLVFLSACSTTASDLTYAPIAPVVPQASPEVATVTVADARDEKDPTYIGAIRGGYGNPLKTLTTVQPASEEVKTAFIAALQARGLYGAGAPATLDVTLKQLSGNWYARHEGHTIFTLTLNDKSGRAVFHDDEDVLKIAGSLITFDAGMFASTDDLRAIVELSMNTAIDQALDKPAFRAALSESTGNKPGS